MAFDRISHRQSDPRRVGSTSKQLEELFTGLGHSLTEAQRAAVDALTPEDTADGTDATTTQALANALKVKVNEIIAALQAS